MVNVNDEMEIVGIKDTEKTVCTGVEMFRKLLIKKSRRKCWSPFRGTKEDVKEVNSFCSWLYKPHTKFEAQVYVLSKRKEEDILLSSKVIDLSFTLEPRMLQE